MLWSVTVDLTREDVDAVDLDVVDLDVEDVDAVDLTLWIRRKDVTPVDLDVAIWMSGSEAADLTLRDRRRGSDVRI